MTLPAYESYQDTGIPWLERLPSHWRIRRLKHIADAFPSNVDKKSYEQEVAVRLCNYTDVYYNDVIFDDPDFMVATASPEQVAKFTLRAGDTIITKDSETPEDIASAAHVPVDMPGVVCGYHLSIVRPHPGTSGAFIKRYFDSAFAKASVHVRANGLTRVGLGQYAVDNLHVPVPPLDEQVAIADFLDRETAKIDHLIMTCAGDLTVRDRPASYIHLLKERRFALISAAVTGKIDVRQRGVTPRAVEVTTARRLVGAVVLELVADTPASGRMTSAKRMYLAEAHARVWELQGQPQRMAAGPFDGVLMSEVEAELARVGHIATSQPGGPNSQVHYRLTGQRGALRAELDALLGDRRTVFDKMLTDLGDLEAKGVEAVATLYAVWNDMLIDGMTPTDDAVIDGVLNDWHAEKRDKFTKADLHNYLGWMRRHGMMPTGRGPRTKSGALL